MKKLLNLKKIFGDIRSEYNTFSDTHEQLSQELADLHSLPGTKADFLENAFNVIDEATAQYTKRLRLEIENVVWKSDALSPPQDFPIVSPWSGKGFAGVDSIGLYGLLGPLIKESLTKIVEQMDWADVTGPPLRERKAAIKRVSKKLEQVEAKLSELRSFAKESGQELAGLTTPGKGKYVNVGL